MSQQPEERRGGKGPNSYDSPSSPTASCLTRKRQVDVGPSSFPRSSRQSSGTTYCLPSQPLPCMLCDGLESVRRASRSLGSVLTGSSCHPRARALEVPVHAEPCRVYYVWTTYIRYWLVELAAPPGWHSVRTHTHTRNATVLLAVELLGNAGRTCVKQPPYPLKNARVTCVCIAEGHIAEHPSEHLIITTARWSGVAYSAYYTELAAPRRAAQPSTGF